MNRNLAALRPECSRSLCGRFGPNWDKAAYFEMIVVRFGLTGATLDYEPEGAGGRRVDFKAVFPGGTVFVEATSPGYNREGVARVHHQEPLLDIVVAEVPRGWRVDIEDLPIHGPDDSRREFRRVVRELFAVLPDPTAVGDRLDLVTNLPNGRLALRLLPGRPDDADALRMFPGQELLENTWDRITRAVRGKRLQARAFHEQGPVLLALDSGWYTNNDDFQWALFGGMHSTLGPDGRIGPTLFDATGVLATQRHAEFAGVLVFADLGFVRGPDPTLFIHPKFTGDLPTELDCLERRELTDAGVTVIPATEVGILERLPFVSRAEFGEM